MPKETIFISSVQKEFAAERKALAAYLREDELLKSFFEPYLFEEMAANDGSPEEVYVGEVIKSHIYLGLLGRDYGFEDAEGVSPTEREFDKAREESKPCWVFIKSDHHLGRHEKEEAFIAKVGERVSRKRFGNLEDLKKEVYNSCVLYLKQKGRIGSDDFDSSLHATALPDCIDGSVVETFVRDARTKRNFPLKESTAKVDVLTHLNLYREGKLTNSALLVFANDPQQFFPTSTVKCAHFHGLVVQKPIPDYKEFRGTVFEVAENAIDFVLSKISLSTGDRSVTNQVETIYEVPRAVIAEGIINAIAHRDYYSKGSIQISVFKDRIEIANPGRLPSELDIPSLKEPHSSYPHNPLLANCMFLTGTIERYGTGIPEMFALSAERGLKSPEFEDDNTFKVTLWRPSSDTDHDADHDTDHDTDHDQKYLRLEDLPSRLVWLLDGELSRENLMQQLELKHRDNFKTNYLDPTMKAGWIEMTLPDKPKSKNQKYRLTTSGLVHKKTLKHGNK